MNATWDLTVSVMPNLWKVMLTSMTWTPCCMLGSAIMVNSTFSLSPIASSLILYLFSEPSEKIFLFGSLQVITRSLTGAFPRFSKVKTTLVGFPGLSSLGVTDLRDTSILPTTDMFTSYS